MKKETKEGQTTEGEAGVHKMLLCEVCGRELRDNQARLGDYHVSCAEIKIRVYTISIDNATEYHKTINSLLYNLELLLSESSDLTYFIGSEIMTELKYRTLPEFEGF